MGMKNQYEELNPVQLLAAAVRNADANSGWIDIKGYDAASLILQLGAGGISFTSTNKIEFVLEEADDNSGTNAANLTTDQLIKKGAGQFLGYSFADDDAIAISDGIIAKAEDAHTTATLYQFGLKLRKPFLRLTANFSGTHSVSTPISAALILGWPHSSPTPK